MEATQYLHLQARSAKHGINVLLLIVTARAVVKYRLMNENECFERLFVSGEICPDMENCETSL